MAKNDKSKLTGDYEGPLFPDAPSEEQVRREAAEAEVPDGSILEVEQWVSGDGKLAEVALAVEKKKGDDARVTLVKDLERLVEDSSGA